MQFEFVAERIALFHEPPASQQLQPNLDRFLQEIADPDLVVN